MKNTNTQMINELAYQIATGECTGDVLEQKWVQLYQTVKPLMKSTLVYMSNKYCSNYNIEVEAFEEQIDSALMKAVDCYQIELGDFVPRVRSILDNLCKNVVRDSKASKRIAMTEAMSLNVTVNSEGEESITFQDQLIAPNTDVTKMAEEAESGVLNLLHKYSLLGLQKQKEAQMICLYMDYANAEERKEALMAFVGADKNWATVRKQVSRAKENFKQFLLQEGMAF